MIDFGSGLRFSSSSLWNGTLGEGKIIDFGSVLFWNALSRKVPSNPDTVLVNGLWDKENADLPIGYPIESLVSFIKAARQ